MKKITKLYLLFYPVYGLAVGFTFLTGDEDDEDHDEIVEYGKTYTIQLLILIFGISITWNMK